MFRIAICDDTQSDVNAIQLLLTAYQNEHSVINIHIKVFSSAKDLLLNTDKESFFDLYLLDIIMPERNGIELARDLRKLGINTPIVFLTHSKNYALEAYNVRAFHYLVKPINRNDLFSVLDAVITNSNKMAKRFIFVSTANAKIKVEYSSIIFVESISRTMLFHLVDGQRISSTTIRVPFAEALSSLLLDRRFLHPHKSFVINMEFVIGISNDSIIMKGNSLVPIPRHRYSEVKNMLFNYYSQCGIRTVGI